MKKISKLVLLLLAGIFVFACAGCTKINNNSNNNANSAADESGWTNNY